jgi:archaellum component FlaC
MEELKIDINRLESKVDRIMEMLKNQKHSTIRLEKHIDFIEHTYEQLHTPLTYVKNRVSWLLGKPTTDLEHIQ